MRIKIRITNKTVKIAVFAVLLALYASFILHQIKLPVADDLARQLKNGEMIVHGDFSPIYKNVYSYTEPENGFNNHHWFSTVIFYLIRLASGFGGLVIFKVLVFLAAFAILFALAVKKADFWLVAAFSLPVIMLTGERSELRPEIFSFLLIAVFLYMLADFEKRAENPDGKAVEDSRQSRRIFWLVPFQLLWVNLHLFFIIGPMLVAGFLVEKIIYAAASAGGQGWSVKNIKNSPIVRRTVLLLLLIVAVCFINPAGWRGALFLDALHNLSRHPIILISELRTVFQEAQDTALSANYWLQLFIFVVSVSLIGFILAFLKKPFRQLQDKPFDKTQGWPIFYFLMAAGSAAAGFSVLRMAPVFVFVSLVFVPANFSELYLSLKNRFQNKYPALIKFFGKIFVVVLLGVCFYYIFQRFSDVNGAYKKPGIGLEPAAAASAEFFKEQNLHGPIFNDPDIGSYLIYYLYPKEKVFTDNRFSDTYSDTFLQEYRAAIVNDDDWQRLLSKYDFNVLFFYQYDAIDGFRSFIYRRANDPDWAMVFSDQYALILARNVPENIDVIKQFGITRENVGERLEHLLKSPEYNDKVAAGDTFNLFDRSDLAFPAFLSIVDKWPHAGKIWWLLGQMELLNDGANGAPWAIMLLQRAIEEGYRVPETYYRLGLAYSLLNQNENAAKAAKEALDINPQYQDALDLLEEIDNSE